MKNTPLHSVHVDAGARMVEFGGWSMPVQYASILEEVTAVRKHSGLFDLSHMGRFLVEGPDAVALVDRIATNYCLNEIRNRKRRAVPTEEVPEPNRTHRGDLASRLSDRDFARTLAAVVPEQEAQAAWLHYVDGFSQIEVAEILGVSRRTVINRLQSLIRRAEKMEGNQ